MKATKRPLSVVTTDGAGVVSHAGSYLLVELAARLGLTEALSWELRGMQRRRRAHDPGAVLRDLAVSIADGGDCLADLSVADHITVLEAELEQIPRGEENAPSMLARGDSSAATHGFLDALRERGILFSIGFDLTEPVREAVLGMSADAWTPAVTQDGDSRDSSAVCELRDFDLSGWPPDTRAICRRERPHPGAQLTFTDHDGFRFQVFITDQTTPTSQRWSGVTADTRVSRTASGSKATGLRNLPFRDFAANEVWLELVLVART